MSKEEVDENGFPILEGGWCDGMGCGNANFGCYCEMWLQSRQEYQKIYNEPYDSRSERGDAWDDSFRFMHDQIKKELAARRKRDHRLSKIRDERIKKYQKRWYTRGYVDGKMKKPSFYNRFFSRRNRD